MPTKIICAFLDVGSNPIQTRIRFLVFYFIFATSEHEYQWFAVRSICKIMLLDAIYGLMEMLASQTKG